MVIYGIIVAVITMYLCDSLCVKGISSGDIKPMASIRALKNIEFEV